MTDRELLQQILNEYLVFSDKTTNEFIASIGVPEQIEPTLVTYLNYSIRFNEKFGWLMINRYWTMEDLSKVFKQLRRNHG